MKVFNEMIVAVFSVLLAVSFTNALSIVASIMAIAWWGYKFYQELK